MAIQTHEEAERRALALDKNKEGMCQQIVRGYFDAPSVGDVDGDGDADARDGYFSEPLSARVNNRNWIGGSPLSFLSNVPSKHGHRALGLSNGLVRSSDFSSKTKRYAAGVMGTGTLEEVERAMGVHFVGWTKTINGFMIPSEAKVVPKKQRPKNVRVALDALRAELRSSNATDKELLDHAKKILLKIDPR